MRLATVEADHRAPIEHMLGYVAYPAILVADSIAYRVAIDVLRLLERPLGLAPLGLSIRGDADRQATRMAAGPGWGQGYGQG